jgi:hypothetical protein
MATWKKVIVSGSNANLTALQVDNLTSGQVVIGGGTAGNLSTTAINGTGNIVATTGATGLVATGSFSGSFRGNFVGTTDLPDLTQGTGITAFTYDGSTTATVAVSGASTLSTNNISKWTGTAFANSSLTDNGTTITGTTSIQLTGANSSLSGSFSGSFFGNGAGLTGVTATPIFPTTAKTDLVSTDQFFINDGANKFVTYANLLTDLAGTNLAVEGTDSLTLATTITGLTSLSATSLTGSLLGNVNGTSSWATNAVTASTFTITDTTTGAGPYYLVFTSGSAGAQIPRIDTATLTFNATTNVLTVTSSFATSASFASTSSIATSALFATNATSASFATNATSASFATNATSASFATNATSASFINAIGSNRISGSLVITGSLEVTGSITGSLLGTATNAVSASFATNATSASFATNATSASFATNSTNAVSASLAANATSASFATNAANATSASFATNATSASFATNSTSASFATNSTSASFASTVGSIANNVTNNADNRVLTATGGGTINGEANLIFDGTTLTVTGNHTVTGNLVVQGTASFQNTTNKEIADRFVLYASGSTSAGDGGIVVQQTTQNVGELFGFDSSTTRWAFTSSFNASTSAFTPDAFVSAVVIGAGTSPTAAPARYQVNGNIFIGTDEGIWIYS